MTHCTYIRLQAALVVALCCGTVEAQEAHVSVAWKIAPACGANFPGAVLQQDMETQLRGASIAVSRVHSAGLLSDISCQAAGAKTVSVQQCLSLSQAVSEPSAANGLHLATTWRSCQAYVCGKQNCGQIAPATQRTLIGQFIPAFRALKAESKAPDPPAAPEKRLIEGSIPAVYVAASKPVLNPRAIFYSLYILTCIAVLARWQWCR